AARSKSAFPESACARRGSTRAASVGSRSRSLPGKAAPTWNWRTRRTPCQASPTASGPAPWAWVGTSGSSAWHGTWRPPTPTSARRPVSGRPHPRPWTSTGEPAPAGVRPPSRAALRPRKRSPRPRTRAPSTRARRPWGAVARRRQQALDERLRRVERSGKAADRGGALERRAHVRRDRGEGGRGVRHHAVRGLSAAQGPARYRVRARESRREAAFLRARPGAADGGGRLGGPLPRVLGGRAG